MMDKFFEIEVKVEPPTPREAAQQALAMTRDDIMALANQTAGQHWMDEAHIQRFAALVTAAEREACAKACEEEIKRAKPVYSVVAENALKAIRARGGT